MHQSAASPPTKSSVVKRISASRYPFPCLRHLPAGRRLLEEAALLRLLNAGDVVGATAQFAE